MNWITGIYKPMFASKFKFAKVFRVTFKVNKIKDEILMEGHGLKKGAAYSEDVFCEPMKVSENQNYVSIVKKNIQKFTENGECDNWLVVYLVFDFPNNFVKTEVWYVSKSGQKQYKTFKSEITANG